MAKSFSVLTLLLAAFTLFPARPAPAATQDAIVKVFTTARKFSYDSPWQATGIEQWTGSGCIIAGRRILTNAHVVSNATYIEVQRNGDPKKYTAEVIAASHEADLALLRVDDEPFFAGVPPLELGDLPELLDSVVVYGFPEGGEGLSVTKGIVSRIEVTSYVHSWQQFLGLQIDAAINSGNSGGPVIMDGKIVGVAMQVKPDAENIGYLVPAPIIRHFLRDLEDGRYDGFPADGILAQPLDNPTLRAAIGLPAAESGVLVSRVTPGTSAAGVIFPGDVILQIDQHDIANDGSVLLRPGLRVSADYVINSHQLGDRAQLKVWRVGVTQQVSLPLTMRRTDDSLVRSPEYDTEPEYYILAGLVLMPLSVNYLEIWGEKWPKEAPMPLLKFLMEDKAVAGEEVVFVSNLLSSKMTTGYDDYVANVRVVAVNGQRFGSFREFTRLADEALRGNTPIILTTEEHTIIAVSPQEHRSNLVRLLELYGIAQPSRVRSKAPASGGQ